VNDLFFSILGFAALLAIDYLAIATRAAYTQTNHARLLSLREQMEAKVSIAVSLLYSLPRLKASLNLTLLLARFFILGIVFLYTAVIPNNPIPWLFWILMVLSAIVVFWFEWAVENQVSRNPEIWAVKLAPFARIWVTLMKPLMLPLAFGSEEQITSESIGSVTEDELKTLVDAGQEEGVFEQGERQMIFSIFQLRETLAREIMVPRIDMLVLDVLTSLTDAVDTLLQSGHSRVPVFEETVDNTLGLLYAKDLLRVWRTGGQLNSLRDLLRPAYFVPEAKKVDELLTELQAQRIHMAIVVDEYGGVAGLVTLEDIVEEIVGEILDEYDQAEEAPYQVLKTGEHIFLGRVDLDDFNEIMSSNLPSDEADTIGGFMYSRIGRVPEVGEKVKEDTLLLTVEQVSGRRIRKVRAQWLLPEADEGEENQHANERSTRTLDTNSN
jgi:CBS domain containing-hemolysin-like protein